jgi:acyl-[acyl-carrier-protein] desaturase
MNHAPPLSLPPEVQSSVDVNQRGSMSRDARRHLVGRYCHSLYRWYLSRSQEARNWNPDRSFDWRSLRQDHNERLMGVIEGFYAVEQYAPDYTAELTRIARAGYGHSQFQIRWGAEEEKHSDLWRNVLLFGRARTPEQLERYTNDLRANAWVAPFDTPLEMLFYTVFQERATQLIYLKTASLARADAGGESADPVLAKVITAIAVDEAAHYDFFLALARVHLYYFPQDALEALVKVIRTFVMPAARIVPNYDAFIKVLYESHLFSPGIYGREVAKPALSALGIESVKAVEHGLAQTKAAPGLDGATRPAPYAGCNFAVLESTVRGLFHRVNRYESAIGLDRFQPAVFAAVDC